ncbi:MAG: hypothetical protein H6734_11240 [Alphaproteobacteria bacterium]|nr:hypothetical protein [Alphaproteobacteria bacterium]
MILTLLATALAGDGPWTLAAGDTNVFVGVTSLRFTGFNDGVERTPIALPTAIVATDLRAVVTRGLVRGVEAEAQVPWRHVRATQSESPGCTTDAPRPDFCVTSKGLADVVLKVKGRLLDEAALRPLTVSLALATRIGEAYADERGRLTKRGDGQVDVGAQLSLGRTGALGSQGWYQVAATGSYFYRFPHQPAVDDQPKIPSDEVGGDGGFVVSPRGWWSVGPLVTHFSKLRGYNVTAAPLATLDGFASLYGHQTKVGGRIGIHSADGFTVSISGLATVFALNNPYDTTAISVGVGWYRPKRMVTPAAP